MVHHAVQSVLYPPFSHRNGYENEKEDASAKGRQYCSPCSSGEGEESRVQRCRTEGQQVRPRHVSLFVLHLVTEIVYIRVASGRVVPPRPINSVAVGCEGADEVMLVVRLIQMCHLYRMEHIGSL